MREHITFHLVSPEKKLASVEASSVKIPGMEGDITLLPDHADFLTTLRPGIIQVESSSGIQEFLVTGGFVEVSGSIATVLAEKAVVKSEANKELVVPFIYDAEEQAKTATNKEKARVDLRVNDLKLISETLN